MRSTSSVFGETLALMATGTFRADPYLITMGDDNTNFGEDVLAAIFQLPRVSYARGVADNATRWGLHNGNHILLDTMTTYGGLMYGTAVQVRMSDLPQGHGAAGPIDLQLAVDEGLAKHIAFLWAPTPQHLWVQRDNDALATGTFMDYLRMKSVVAFDHFPVFSDDAGQRALSLKSIKSLKLQLWAKPAGPAPQASRFKRLFDFVQARRRYGAERITIEIKPAPGGHLGGETTEFVKEIVEAFNDETDETGEVHNAIVTGQMKKVPDPNDEEQVVNLLRNRHIAAIWGVANDRFRDPRKLTELIRRVYRENRKFTEEK